MSCSSVRNSMVLSVIIPTRNRAQCLANLLDSLARQEPVPFEWEVIVVDNASTDDTAAVTRQKNQALLISIRYVLEPRPGLHQGRHRGAREARGEYLGYLDDDTIVAPTWVQGVELLAQGTADAIAGRIVPRWEAEPPDWLLAQIKDGVNGPLTLLDLGLVARPIQPSQVWGAGFFIPRKLVFELGGFHPDSMPAELLRYRGDGETALMRKFKAAGLNAWYDPRATVYHVIGAERLTVEYLCKRAYNQGVSDSFTQIRATHLDGKPHDDQRSLRHYVRRVREMSLTEVLGALAGQLKRLARRILPPPSPPDAEMQKRMKAAYWEGWRFHQNAVGNDHELFEYVTRSNYLDEV